MKTKQNKHTVNIITLGCSKNLVDSEYLMKQFDANGLQVVYDNDNFDVPLVVINTCGFIKDAKEESVNTILRFAKAKEEGRIKNLFVMGCLSQRYKKDLEKEIPEIDKLFGTNDIETVVKSLGYDYKKNLAGERLLTTPKHYAYVKISEGCDRHCSFCAIPLMRGHHKSKSIESIVSEAKMLVQSGVKEIMLIAQDLSYYGVDLYRSQRLPDLLRRLSDIPSLNWIRLHYAYPAGFPKEVLKVIAERKNICNYLDIPFQHISDTVLKKMRRGITGRQTYALIDEIRNSVPDIALRTTLMVGHPGEGEAEFAELMNFVEKTRFNRLGVFTYSEEEDTYGARNFKDTIRKQIKQARADQLMETQQAISRDLNNAMIGKTITVLIDNIENGYYFGRSESDSPEVDNEVIVKTDKLLGTGEFHQVLVTSAGDFDLETEVI